MKEVKYDGFIVCSDGTILDAFGNPAYTLKDPVSGYTKVRNHHSQKKIWKASRLVWTAFNGPIPEGMQVDHIDNNRSNDALSNLQLLTASENSLKARANSNADRSWKVVQMVDLEGNVVATYRSATHAEKATVDTIKANHRRVSECCHGLKDTHRGYTWRFKYYTGEEI